MAMKLKTKLGAVIIKTSSEDEPDQSEASKACGSEAGHRTGSCFYSYWSASALGNKSSDNTSVFFASKSLMG